MSVPRVEEPLGHATPYIIPAYEGEALRIPGSKSTIRILASAKESDGLISVLHLDGVAGYEPGFHYHNKAHDIFMCVKGKIKVWAGDKCRLLGPGDFCSVPPVSPSRFYAISLACVTACTSVSYGQNFPNKIKKASTEMTFLESYPLAAACRSI